MKAEGEQKGDECGKDEDWEKKSALGDQVRRAAYNEGIKKERNKLYIGPIR